MPVRPKTPAQSGAAGKAAKTRQSPDAADTELARGFVLQGYDRTTDELRLELHLEPVQLARLRALFDFGDDVDLCNAYPLDAAHAGVLQEWVSEPIDLEEYAFFLQRYA